MGIEEEELLEGTERREYSVGAAVGIVGNDPPARVGEPWPLPQEDLLTFWRFLSLCSS